MCFRFTKNIVFELPAIIPPLHKYRRGRMMIVACYIPPPLIFFFFAKFDEAVG
jgi:hypothetical protein